MSSCTVTCQAVHGVFTLMQATSTDETAIVLVHGFGAGVFAWRNVMQPLADGAGCRVIAFDRPAFGPFLLPVLPHVACSHSSY